MHITTLHNLFLIELQDIVSFEGQILEAMPAIIEKTTTKELRSALKMHIEETLRQHEMVQDLCDEFGIDPDGKHCIGMEGLIEQGQEILTANKPSAVLDLAMINNLQKIELYEVAAYGSAENYAQEMGHQDTQDLLMTVLHEEQKTAMLLGAMAETIIPQVPFGMDERSSATV